MKNIKIIDKSHYELMELSKWLGEIAKDNLMEIETCAELIDLSEYGIKHSSCIDKKLIEKIIGYPIMVKKDKNQRGECQCIESVEVGVYNTCSNGCKYCYANYSEERVKENIALYDAAAPILCSKITEEDKITERAVKSIKVDQMSIGF